MQRINGVAAHAGSFFLYGTICFASLLFIYLIVPETKGKTLEEIQQVSLAAAFECACT